MPFRLEAPALSDLSLPMAERAHSLQAFLSNLRDCKANRSSRIIHEFGVSNEPARTNHRTPLKLTPPTKPLAGPDRFARLNPALTARRGLPSRAPTKPPVRHKKQATSASWISTASSARQAKAGHAAAQAGGAPLRNVSNANYGTEHVSPTSDVSLGRYWQQWKDKVFTSRAPCSSLPLKKEKSITKIEQGNRLKNARGSSHIIHSKAAQENGSINEKASLFVTTTTASASALNSLAVFKLLFVGLNRLKWNDDQVQEMVVTLPELAFMTNKISKELNGEVGDKHDVHTAKNRKDGDSNHLMNLHSQFHDPKGCWPV
ncbi:hypothetical protein ABBQ38_012069 [Trebouxia sp. C0009 RCD-2024]